jgi:hypothetical protein
MSIINPEADANFIFPEAYKGMDEIFGGDPESRIKDIIRHYEQHLEFLREGYYDARKEVIEFSIKAITAALLEAEATDPSNQLQVYQIEIKHNAIMNELKDLPSIEAYDVYQLSGS